MRDRARAALALLAQDPRVDATRLGAIGYCFGGTTVMELAYSGADLAGVVSFHGGLNAPDEAALAGIKAKLLILHGAADPTVTPAVITATQEALTRAHADWQMVYYGGALHGFTNPANAAATGGAVAYDPKAAARSWAAMRDFFSELFSPR